MNPIFALASLALLVSPSAHAPEASRIRWEPYSTTGADGMPLEGELGRLRVPESREKPDGATIELAFVRFKTTNPDPAPPMIYLVGGPGPSGIEHCVAPATGRMLRLLDFCDVIGLDQRGTGACAPNLESGPGFALDLPLDRAITRDEYIAAYGSAVEECAAYWKEQGVDLGSYNTRESADDIEDLRRALGLERIALWGQSYGTHLGVAYLRRHGAHVERAVLLRIEGPDDTLKLPGVTQRYLEQLSALVAADEAWREELPDLLATVRDLLKGLAEKTASAELEVDGKSVRVAIGPFDLQFFLANALGLAFQLRDVPSALVAMRKGDWSALTETAYELRRGEVGSAMALAMDCASGGSSERLARIEAERRDPANLLGDAVNAPYPRACAASGVPALGPDFRAPFECNVPVLFVSGSLDARTPSENALALLPHFPRATHVIANNAGHEPIEMLSPDYRALLMAFLRGEPTQSRAVDLPAPRFPPTGAR